MNSETVLVITIQEAKITGVDGENFFQYILFPSGNIQVNYKSIYPRERSLAGIENVDGTEGIGYALGTKQIQHKSIQYSTTEEEPPAEEPPVEEPPIEEPGEPEEPSLEYVTKEYFTSTLTELEYKYDTKIEKIESEQASKWAVYSDDWTTGIAFYNPTNSDISTKVHIGDKTFNLTVPANTCVKKAITEYIATQGEYIITIDSYDIILQVPMAYIPQIGY